MSIHQILFKKADLASLKSDANELDIDKFENVPSRLNSLKSKADKLDVDELKPFPVDVVKKTVYDESVKKDNTIDTNGPVKKNRLWC